MTQPRPPRDLYKEAGVDVDKGDRLVEWLQAGSDTASATPFGAPVAGIGGFAALFRPDFKGMEDPLLVTGTDGVGTKVLLGIESGLLRGLGEDLVAMCVNDLYTVGGRPLFFLDYYATGTLDEAQFKDILIGIRSGCRQSGALLMGGETAELPGLYERGHFDLAGFVVGVVDGAKRLGPERVRPGDRLFALPSSGFHSNGYSLIRHWLKASPASPDRELLERLMAPTRIYHEVPALLAALGPETVHALANITGGGISGNLPRVMPRDVICHIEPTALPTPAWMASFIASHDTTPLAQEGVFNLGCGMIAAIAQERGEDFVAACRDHGLDVQEIGQVRAGNGEARVQYA